MMKVKRDEMTYRTRRDYYGDNTRDYYPNYNSSSDYYQDSMQNNRRNNFMYDTYSNTQSMPRYGTTRREYIERNHRTNYSNEEVFSNNSQKYGYQDFENNEIRSNDFQNSAVFNTNVTQKERKSLNLSTKAKIHLSVYIGLILLILSLIIANAVHTHKHQTISAETEVVATDVVIPKDAYTQSINNEGKVEALALIEDFNGKEEQEAPSNWFDRLCARIEKVFK